MLCGFAAWGINSLQRLLYTNRSVLSIAFANHFARFSARQHRLKCGKSGKAVKRSKQRIYSPPCGFFLYDRINTAVEIINSTMLISCEVESPNSRPRYSSPRQNSRINLPTG